MKTELNALLAVSRVDKHLDINGAFRVTSIAVSAYGEPLAVYKDAEPHHMALRLEYRLAHDKAYGKSLPLTSTTPDGLKAEISEGMKQIMSEITEHMLKDWSNGYILGKVQGDDAVPRKTNDSPIAVARMAARMTQAQLADAVGVDARHISRWEQGIRHPKFETLQKIAAALDVDVMTLMPH